MAEQLYNNYATTVASGGYSSGSGFLNITGSTSGFTAPFHIGIYDSTTLIVVVLLHVTGVNSSSQYAVTAEGTDASASAGDLVRGVLTVAAIGQIKLDAFQRNVNSVSFSATPTFNLSLGDQEITLTGNVTSSSLSGLLAGNRVVFCINQDSGGGHTFVWPAAVHGGMVIGSTPSTTSIQEFWSPDGTTLYAISPGVINE